MEDYRSNEAYSHQKYLHENRNNRSQKSLPPNGSTAALDGITQINQQQDNEETSAILNKTMPMYYMERKRGQSSMLSYIFRAPIDK